VVVDALQATTAQSKLRFQFLADLAYTEAQPQPLQILIVKRAPQETTAKATAQRHTQFATKVGTVRSPAVLVRCPQLLGTLSTVLPRFVLLATVALVETNMLVLAPTKTRLVRMLARLAQLASSAQILYSLSVVTLMCAPQET